MVDSRFTEVGRPTELNNDIVGIEDPSKANEFVKFNGKRRTYPGAIALMLLIVGAALGLVYFGKEMHSGVNNEAPTGYASEDEPVRKDNFIDDGRITDGALDPKVVNPVSYKNRKCTMPDYTSKDNRIQVSYGGGDTQTFPIKGVTWSGMETKDGVPRGLWDNKRDGTSMYQVGNFLVKNGFNSVRLPLSVDSVARNIIPDASLVNEFSSKALRLERYHDAISTVVQGLGVHDLSVLLDFHTLTPDEPGELWYNNVIREKEYLAAIDALAELACNSLHWNILGIEIKNAPNRGTWDDSTDTDWKAASKKYGNYILEKCPSWLVFVDGIQAKHIWEHAGETATYRDFDGGGLQLVGDSPLELSVKNKVVYSPHYYSPSWIAQRFFYKSGEPSGNGIENFEELDDSALKEVVEKSMDDMFGYLTSSQGAAVVLAEFGGLFGPEDLHPKKTSTRVIEFIVNALVTKNYGGGYLLALNPETSWRFNPTSEEDVTPFGLLQSTWRKTNEEYLTELQRLNDLKGIDVLQCIK